MTDKAQAKPLKIAILGTAPSSVCDAPFDDDSWEIWGCSTGPTMLKRVTRWFEIHDLKRKARQVPPYYKWLCETDVPVYLDKADPKITTGIVGWQKAIIEKWSGDFSPDYVYNTNSISWMICHALLEIEANGGVGEIGVYGVDMAVGSLCVGAGASEYAHQRPSCEYWIGYARASGVPCHVPQQSDLLKSREMYGFDTDDNGMYYRFVARGEELNSRKRDIAQQLDIESKVSERAQGGVQVLTQLMEATGGSPTPGNIQEALHALDNQAKETTATVGRLQGDRMAVEGAIVNHDHVQQGCPVGGNLF